MANMADDDLTAPLGQGAKKQRRTIKLPIALPIAGAMALFLLTFAGWALLADDPLGGEPVAVVATNITPAGKPDRTTPAAAGQPSGVQGPRSYDGPGGASLGKAEGATLPAAAPGTKTVTIIDGSTGKRQEVPISTAREARAPVEERLLEVSRHGALPRIAPDGARPAEAYARAVRPLPNKKDGPRVAIVVGGLGISAAATQQAIAKLPGPVTLAFPPYGAQVERDATAARADGHEVLLQLPMEPFEYPDNDPGPHTLLTTLNADQNIDRMHWLMSRFQGYVGVASYMGARFTSTEQSLAPVLKETAKRGLLYVDDGASSRSLAGQIASANNMPFAKAEIVLDAVPTPAQIDKALNRLEALARERGVAIGFASAVPVAIDRIAQWAKAAEGRGLQLVPITAVAIKPKSS
jgi:polysaccharide deacetylase 2 family uncharacterized protein YibQ